MKYLEALKGIKRNAVQDVGFLLAFFYLLLVFSLAALAPVLPFSFSGGSLDLLHPYLEPSFLNPEAAQSRHWLGTDGLGRDVLVIVVYGFRTAFSIALPVMLISSFIGIWLGSMAGFYGNRSFKIATGDLLAILIGLFLVFFYGVYLRCFDWGVGGRMLLVGLFVLMPLLARGLRVLSFFMKKISLPVDELLLKTTKLLTTIPRLMLVLCLAAFIPAGFGSVFLLISLTFWTATARLTRTEVMRIRNLPYLEAARVTGLSDWQMIGRHILPNAAGALLTAFCFGFSSLIGLESGLSFLGIGLPPETPSWGRLLAGVRLNPEAWWLLVFPGLALWFTVLAIQTCGNFFRKYYSRY